MLGLTNARLLTRARPSRRPGGARIAVVRAMTGKPDEKFGTREETVALKTQLLAAIKRADNGYNSSENGFVGALLDELATHNPVEDPWSTREIDGTWRSLYTTMLEDRKMSRGDADLATLTFGKLPHVSVRMNFEESTLQRIDSKTGDYVNYITFHSPAGDFDGLVELQGKFRNNAEHPARADVRFHRVTVYPQGSSPDDPAGAARLRSALGLSPDVPLSSELGDGKGVPGFVDIEYYDGDLRVVKGNRGNRYLLERA